MSSCVLVRYGVTGQTQTYSTGSLSLAPQDRVLVDTDLGMRMGVVLMVGLPPSAQTPPVIRLATAEDLLTADKHAAAAREAHTVAKNLVETHQLHMRIIDAEILLTGTRTVFYFVSEDRVDFRALVRDLARRFHTRIELRQLGLREATRRTGGVGRCGREVCCATWLPELKPVTLRMAKDQGLSQQPEKLAGLCGRLRCCLAYEHVQDAAAP